MAKNTKKTTRKKGPTAAQRKTIQAQQNRRQMAAVVLFAVGLLFLALTFIQGTKVWLGIHNVLFGLFGWSAYFIAPLILYVAIITAKDKPIHSIKTKLWQIGVLIVMISGAIEIFTGLPEVEGFKNMVVALYDKGIAHDGGGVFGAILGAPLLALTDSPGPQIIILLAVFVFLMLLTGSTLVSLFQAIRKPVDGIESAYSSHLEERQRRMEEQGDEPPKEKMFNFFLPKEEKPQNVPPKAPAASAPSRSARFDIDVDISDDKDPTEFQSDNMVEVPELDTQESAFYEGLSMPVHPVMAEPKFSFDQFEKSDRAEPAFVEETKLGVDTPVEYISVVPEEKPAPIVISDMGSYSRPHPLEEDIRLAKEDDLAQIISQYLQGIRTGDEDEFDENQKEYDGDRTAEESDLEQGNASDFWRGKSDGETIGQEDIPLPEAIQRQLGSNVIALPVPPSNRDQPSAPRQQAPLLPKMEEPPVENPVPKYQFPPLELLKKSQTISQGNISQELRENGEKLVATLESFGVKTKIINISRGPAVTRYELQPSAGVKISRITGLADDIALNLAAAGIRIEAPIPNKPAVGIEVPNKTVSMVAIREIMDSKEFRKPSDKISIALGKDITGGVTIANIAQMPHMLIAGATGSGKSVCINSIIISVLYKYSPEEVKLLMIDPKVVELGIYNGIPHLLVPVVTNAKKAAGALAWAVSEMLDRYKTFAGHTVRDIAGYNKLAEQSDELSKMPQILIIIDELADLMMAAPNEVEDSICRLAQMARAAGMHLVIATQRPSVDVITGVIKANIPSRIAFSVSSQVDSRTILDSGGAEKLLGRGDMLFFPVGAAKPTRIQGCFVSDDEVEKVVEYVKQMEEPDYDEEIVEEIEKLTVSEKSSSAMDDGGGFEEEDELTSEAIQVILEAGQASISQLQRRLRIGYARAGRLIDTLEQMGIVGPHEGSKPRQVLMTNHQYMEMQLMNEDALAKPERGTNQVSSDGTLEA